MNEPEFLLQNHKPLWNYWSDMFNKNEQMPTTKILKNKESQKMDEIVDADEIDLDFFPSITN